jgi:hypothetical protein
MEISVTVTGGGGRGWKFGKRGGGVKEKKEEEENTRKVEGSKD